MKIEDFSGLGFKYLGVGFDAPVKSFDAVSAVPHGCADLLVLAPGVSEAEAAVSRLPS